MKFTKGDIEGIISMANRRIRQGGVVKENLTTENADGKTGKTGKTDGNGLERTETDGQDLRFLLSEYSEEERELIAAVLKPFVGFNLNRTDEEYQEYLRKKGVAVSTRDAHAFAVTAMRGNVADYNQRKGAETRGCCKTLNSFATLFL